MGGTRLQENGRMNWLEQVHQMKDRDIRTIEQHELQKLQQDAVEHGLPQEECCFSVQFVRHYIIKLRRMQ